MYVLLGQNLQPSFNFAQTMFGSFQANGMYIYVCVIILPL